MVTPMILGVGGVEGGGELALVTQKTGASLRIFSFLFVYLSITLTRRPILAMIILSLMY